MSLHIFCKLNSCGHLVHNTCIQYDGANGPMNWFTCPVCRCYSNFLIPKESNLMKYSGNKAEEMETDKQTNPWHCISPNFNLKNLIEPLLEDPDDFLPQNLDKMCEDFLNRGQDGNIIQAGKNETPEEIRRRLLTDKDTEIFVINRLREILEVELSKEDSYSKVPIRSIINMFSIFHDGSKHKELLLDILDSFSSSNQKSNSNRLLLYDPLTILLFFTFNLYPPPKGKYTMIKF